MATQLSSPSTVPPQVTSSPRVFARPAVVAIVLAVAVPAISGLVAGWLMPRGSVDTEQALILMALCAITGGAAGYILNSRWALLLAPVVHLAVFELMRIGEQGPTVDGIELSSMYGILAFLVGRGLYLLIGIFPMTVFAAHGAAVARWQSTEASTHPTWKRHPLRTAGGVLATVLVLVLAVLIARPASVSPVTGPNGSPITGSIAELQQLTVGDNQQWLEIRGASEDLPVLLYVSGGPGQSDLAFSRVLLDELTQDFIVVGWDQRGNGKSYADWDRESMTLDRAVSDMLEVSTYLRERFDEDAIYVLGESWGTTLSVLAAQEAPDLYHAVISSGQMVSQRETDRLIYEDLMAWAEDHDDTDLADQLRDMGEPPYPSVLDYGFVMSQYPKLEGDYDPPASYVERGEAGNVGFWGIMGSEYTFMDKANIFRGLIDTFDVLYPQLQEIDFRTDVPSLNVPIYILQGEHELEARKGPVDEWFAMLDAPTKEIRMFENGGHAVAFEHADSLHRMLLDEILPATYPASAQ